MLIIVPLTSFFIAISLPPFNLISHRIYVLELKNTRLEQKNYIFFIICKVVVITKILLKIYKGVFTKYDIINQKINSNL
ncbi:hypothetical protein UT300005_32930 [Clostridium sp. CTA-5]